MKPKYILMLSVLAGLLAVLLVQVQLRSERGAAVVVFRATETVEPGQALGSRIEAVTLPGERLFPNLLKEAPTADLRDFVATAELRETVHRGQIVLYRHLESSVGRSLQDQIPEGRKAISIEVDAATAVAFLVEPQDRVDVLATLEVPEPRPAAVDFSSAMMRDGEDPELVPQLLNGLMDPGRPAKRTEVLLTEVEVLAVGRRFRRAEPSELGARYDTVTLLVSEEEATRLVHARDAQGGALSLVLRGSESGKEPS